MELKNDPQSHAALDACIDKYYRDKGVPCRPYGEGIVKTSVIDGKVYEDEYERIYFVARKYFINYSIPIDTRNFFAMLSLAIGPNYVPMRWLVTEENKSKFSMDSTTEAVVHNLAMLDEYLAGRFDRVDKAGSITGWVRRILG
ncbi:hypothetical protein [Verminephrobacter aporrectodeae]|uniref:hypothetical protein n=1 Tax=Verminephrobacter aporrectodeae TaxID=1110389 RepID=UPI00224392CC|nr:hypothetical protein [Verminephrobacter aporrectodeae]